MSRIDTLIASQGPAATAQNTMVDGATGGFGGLTPDISNWLGQSPYVKMQGIAFLLEAPRGFRDLADPTYMTKALKNMIENQMTSWDGIDLSLTVEIGEREMGNSGQTLQHVTKTTRGAIEPASTLWDINGNYWGKFLTTWIESLMPHPDSGIVGNVLQGRLSSTEILLDYDSCSVLFVEPDVTMTKALKAVVVFNMRPQGNGEQTISMSKGTANEAQQLSITWTGTGEYGHEVEALGTSFLAKLALTNANPNGRVSHLADEAVRQGWTDITAATEDGYIESLAKITQVAAT